MRWKVCSNSNVRKCDDLTLALLLLSKTEIPVEKVGSGSATSETADGPRVTGARGGSLAVSQSRSDSSQVLSQGCKSQVTCKFEMALLFKLMEQSSLITHQKPVDVGQ